MATTPELSASPWHAGELALQERVGVVAQMDTQGRRVVRPLLIDQHRAFYPLLPFVVLGTVDADGHAWATLLAGAPGFLHSPTPDVLSVAARLERNDPAANGLFDGAPVGLLGIELHTRRRNRLNGVVRALDANKFDVQVQQAYGNCNRYIHLRQAEYLEHVPVLTAGPTNRCDRLTPSLAAMIAASDTFFVASYADLEDGTRGVDVSHRGGKRGFVRVGDDGVLTIPDFSGNLFFNTLGNILLNRQAGLTFVDFATGDVLQLSGEAEVDLDSAEIATFKGAERLWRFKPSEIIHRAAALPLRWKMPDDPESPFSLLTGDWTESAARHSAAALASTWRPFRVARVVEESSTIRSLHLEPADGAGMLVHRAGQFLPIRLTPEGASAPVLRTYTLSVAPSDNYYRISVKREGVASRHLHEVIREGDLIETRAPSGDFTIDPFEIRPVVLLAAGIGITPMLAMLRDVVYEGERTRRFRRTWLIYGARSLAERAFDVELNALARRAKGAVKIVRVLSSAQHAETGRDFDVEGRIDVDLLRRTLPFDNFDFYLCGPPTFMQSLYDGLRRLDISDDRIHAESFGAASMIRTDTQADDATPAALPSKDPVPVLFSASGKEARWAPGDGTLLDVAEARGLSPEFGCRAGICGACRTRVIEGAIAYRQAPSFKVGAGEALICCAVPAAPAQAGENRLILDL
ncbi:MAG TPA: pyridoxamine 5'-phosphate oxidase family protein [Paraburkholderia sp.]|jgi:hypothetical protein|nr:pyridoxamine 5'-phosphate oxidase family protein [Paraburkholderia sp.]